MKVINIGSLNMDRIYQVNHFVTPGETIKATGYSEACGGKGLNQSIALARAGVKVLHVGAVGADGEMLLDTLKASGVDINGVKILPGASGHAVIQVNPDGQNDIIICGGANDAVSEEMIDEALKNVEEGDIVLLQNEISNVAYAIGAAKKTGAIVAFNPSPVNEKLEKVPMEDVDIFLVNEIEGKAISGAETEDPKEITDRLRERFPESAVVLTLGDKGCIYFDQTLMFNQEIFKVKTVDTTAAGDTFTGYFLAGIIKQMEIHETVKRASAASAIAVSRPGASPSIPTWKQVEEFLKERS